MTLPPFRNGDVTMIKLYENIKKRRLELNLSQQKLADLTGYTDKSMIAKIEKGKVDLSQSKLELFAKVLGVKPGELMGSTEDEPSPLHGLPIIGIVCAGDGVYCADDFLGSFDLATHIDADFALKVTGDSMVGAHIYDGDYAFIKKNDYFTDGDIYAVELLLTSEASLKKIYENDNNVILTPCNADYPPVATTLDQIRIIGRCVGVYHNR